MKTNWTNIKLKICKYCKQKFSHQPYENLNKYKKRKYCSDKRIRYEN